jgi:hypothetical protein
MGLDQYAYSREPIDYDNGFDWRKHPNLQQFMMELYYKKGGTADSFNCVPMRLELEDIDNLELSVTTGELPQGGGFFHGCDADEYYKEQDLKFIAWARKELEAGREVYYDSWW